MMNHVLNTSRPRHTHSLHIQPTSEDSDVGLSHYVDVGSIKARFFLINSFLPSVYGLIEGTKK